MLSVAVLYLALATPHILYYYVWTQPQAFQKKCQQVFPRFDPVSVFATMAALLKVWQAVSLFVWYAPARETDASLPPTWLLVVAIVLMMVGQILNVSTIKAIGKVGIYYGCRLGHKVEWYEGFPFTVCRNPQYVGAVLSIWGLAALLYTPQLALELTAIASWGTLCFAFSGYVEETM